MRDTRLRLSMTTKTVTWACPFCGAKSSARYQEFVERHGEMDNWEYQKASCKVCGEAYCFGERIAQYTEAQ